MPKKKSAIVINENKILSLILPAVFLLCVFFASSYRLAGDDDFFWHLATGRFIAENHYVPDKDVFGHVTGGTEWIPFEWGWDLISYGLYSFGGYNAIMIFRSVLLCAFFLLYYLLLRKFSVNTILSIIMLFILLIGMLDRLSPRPHLFTYLFILIVMYIFLSFKYINREKYLKKIYFIPLIFLFWANIHMGVIAGGLLLVLFVISEALIYFYPVKFASKEIKQLSKDQLKRLILISVISILVLLINPHGIQTYIYAYSHTKLKMLGSIGEWQNPFTGKIDLNFIVTTYKVLLFSGIIILVYAYRRKDITAALITLVFALYSVRAIRFTVDYEIIIIFFLAICLNYFIIHYLIRRTVSEKNPYLNVISIMVSVFILYVTYITYNGKVYEIINYYRSSGWGIDENYMPVQAFNFMQEKKISGKIFNYFETGGYLIWSFPDEKNFIDSRNLNDFIFNEYNSILYMKQGFETKLEQYGIDYILYFNPEMSGRPNDLKMHITAYASTDLKWKLIYWDDKSMLFVKDIPKFSELINRYEYRIMNPYMAFFHKNEFRLNVENNPETTRRELDRKISTDAAGNLYRGMSSMANNYLKGK